MIKPLILCLLVLSLVAGFTGTADALEQSSKPADEPVESADKVAILWTSGDPEVAAKVVLPYVINAKKLGWWKTVRLIVWGPSSKLLSTSKELQKNITIMKELGVELYACKWCADQYQVSSSLKSMGIHVIYYGKPLTKHLKDDWKVLTF